MKVVPQVFYNHSKIEKILVDGLSSVIFKKVNTADTQNERYLSSHALTLVLEGSLQVQDKYGTVTVVPKNHLVFLPKGLYTITDLLPKKKDFEALVFFFDEEITNEFLSSFENPNSTIEKGNLRIPYTENLELFVQTMLSMYRGRNQHQFTKPKLLEFLHLIALTQQGDKFISILFAIKNRERRNIKKFMEANFEKPLDVEDYAYLTGRSISTFRRDFKARYGVAPKKWLIDQRLAKASELLKKSSQSISEIALKSGYENTPHFIKAFQQKFETSPKQYQIAHRSSVEV